MRKDIRLAASIVTYHSPLEALHAAIDSFQKAKLSSRLILVDNASNRHYASQLEQIEGVELVHAERNGGFGYGHNIAMKMAGEYDYYLVMNPDVVIHEGTLEAMVGYMERYTDIGLLVPRVLNTDGTLQPLNKRLPTVFDFVSRRFFTERIQDIMWVQKRMMHYEMWDIGYDKVIDVPFASGCFMLFRRSSLDAVKGFDEKFFMYLEDCDITRRINQAGFRSIYVPSFTITHHWARGSHKSLKLMVVMLRSMIHYYNKWGWKWI